MPKLIGLDGERYSSYAKLTRANKAFNAQKKEEAKQASAGEDFKIESKKEDTPKANRESVASYFCNNCGALVEYGDRVCPTCGIELDWTGIEQ